MSLEVIRGNALNLPLADASVDLIVTSPPYFGLRSYQDGGEHYEGQIGAEATPAEFVDALIAATREMVRVLKPSGSIWVNLGDKYAGSRMDGSSDNGSHGTLVTKHRAVPEGQKQPRKASAGAVPTKSLIGIPWRYALRCIDELGLILRAEVIWAKPNGLPESVTDRVRRSHEQWFHFTVSQRYYSTIDAIRERYSESTARSYSKGDGASRIGATIHGHPSHTRRREQDPLPEGYSGNPLGKLPGSVWTVSTEPLRVPAELGVDHFAAFPSEWPRRIVLGWSPPDGVVLDPFGGTGTTAHVAAALGRRGVSVDLSADYCRLAAHPFLQDKRAAKVLGGKVRSPKRSPRAPYDAPALFEMDGAV